MARKPSVTDEQIRGAIEALLQGGSHATVKNVWEYMRARPDSFASASNTATISRVLKEYRQGQPATSATAGLAVPNVRFERADSAQRVASLVLALNRGLAKVLKGEREALETRLAAAAAQLEAEKAGRARAEAKAEELAAQLAELMAQGDAKSGPMPQPRAAGTASHTVARKYSDDEDVAKLVNLLTEREKAAEEGQPYVPTAPSGWLLNQYGRITRGRSAEMANLALKRGLVVAGPGAKPNQQFLYTPGYYAKLTGQGTLQGEAKKEQNAPGAREQLYLQRRRAFTSRAGSDGQAKGVSPKPTVGAPKAAQPQRPKGKGARE